MMTKYRFCIRTIRDGKVLIKGRYYAPDLDASRFNGIRAAFGLYWTGQEWNDDSVSLWGSEDYYNWSKTEHSEAEPPGDLWPGPFCENGLFKWEWWNRVA